MRDDEEWRPLRGWPQYEVSSLGQVRRAVRGRSGPSEVGHVMSIFFNPTGRGCATVHLSDERGRKFTVGLARNVLAAHRPVPQMARRYAIHRAGNRRDCRLANLAWSLPGSYRTVDVMAEVGVRRSTTVDLGERACTSCGRPFRHYGTGLSKCPPCRDRQTVEARRLEHYDDARYFTNSVRRGNPGVRDVPLPTTGGWR